MGLPGREWAAPGIEQGSGIQSVANWYLNKLENIDFFSYICPVFGRRKLARRWRRITLVAYAIEAYKLYESLKSLEINELL